MKYRAYIYTLALLGALALAAVSGGLLTSSDNVVYAEAPVFVIGTESPSVPENTPPGVNIGDPISATDADEATEEFGNTLTYKLGGTDEASFDIDPSTGQLITKAALDYEKPHDVGDIAENNTYVVMVTVDDGETRDPDCRECTQDVTITVTDVDEPPAAPAPPTVVSGVDESTTTLKVIWHAPENMGPTITDYQVQYKETTDTSYTLIDNIRGTATTINPQDGLEAATSYQVRVRAKNVDESQNSDSDEIAPWSLVGVGSTNKAGNGAPSFDETGTGIEETLTRRVDENEPAREEVGTEVRANAHVDDNALTYRLGGPDADLFDIHASSGQIRTKGSLNHEDPRCYVENELNDHTDTGCDYYVTVSVFDGAGASDARPVNIEVRDRSEAPDAPARPTVRATEKSSRSLDVSWNEPRNPGPPITGYEIRYRKGTSGNYTTIEGITGTKTTVDDTTTADVDERLTRNTSYEVHVKANTNERDSEWSALTTGRTSAGNQDAIFDDRPDDEEAETVRTIERTVNENTRGGQPVGSVVKVRDPDSLTYKLVDAGGNHPDDAAKFDMDKSTGQILTKASLNHEYMACGYDISDDSTECTYTVKVEVRDGLDEHGNKEEDDAQADDTLDDVITVQINVLDVVETPAAPKVTVTSPEVEDGSSTAMLFVTWNKPENTGPPIDDYVVECSGAGITSSNPCPQPQSLNPNGDEVSYTMEDLTPNSSYRVRVRARNDEGLGMWSSQVSQSTSKTGNEIPTITPLATLTVSEDVGSGSAVGADPVQAEDGDSTLSLTYRIEGPNDDLFAIDSFGQIKTRKSLNHEDSRCGYKNADNPTTCTYTVRVKVSDRENGSHSIVVTISVTDVAEPPSAPPAPSVTATADTGRSLEVTWNEPTNTGPPIAGYQVAYRKYRQGTNSDAYQVLSPSGTERKVKISTIGESNQEMPLEPQTQYEVRVRAMNEEGTIAREESMAWGGWSPLRRGTTGASNVRPVFSNTDSLFTLEVAENTRGGQNVGGAVEATDADRGNRLTYSLDGPGKDSFTITSTGQIRTKSGVTYDYESRQSYSVTVKVDDGQRKDNSVATKSVTIDVEDRDEPPSTPSAPMVVGISGSTDSVRVTWNEPGNTGPPITDYDVQCQNCPESVSHDGADRSMIITDLTPGTRYDVQVRAWNAEGHSDWSRSGTGTPNADVTNQVPIFSGGPRTFSVVENTVAAGDPIGNPVTAVDPDLDTVTHTLEGTDAASFTVDAGSGQIRATATLNYEDRSRYSVSVKATDTRGGSATVGVTITVTDVDEPPDTPSPPTVTAASSTSLQVTWDAPENTGPPITDYDYRYREPSGSWTEITNTTITGTAVTIQGLAASTSYDVEVRATNAEGTSDWSNSGFGTTNAPGANNPPVFPDGTSATRSVSATASAGTSIGLPVAATDADSADTVAYSLEGRDAASFAINETNGQLLTKSGVTLLAGETYTVVVAADDGTDSARITVTIEATVAPPNNPPVFSDGASATRNVREDAAPGTSIGSPVRATDADTGDTVTHILEGTDAAAFTIVASSGQIRTLAALDATTKATYAVTVRATDGRGGSDTIDVTITVTTALPTTFGCATRGAVDNASNTGLVADCEALLRARDNLENGARILNWSVVRPISQWDGVTVSGTPQRVTRLNLRELGLVGTVPADLNNLTMLTRLWLHKNSLEGEIPDLSGLTNLESLWLSGKDMNLSGDISRLGLGSKTRLDTVSLWGNRLTGSIPDLSRLRSLVRVKLQSNSLSGGIPATLGSLSSLRDLRLRNNPLGGSIPTQLNNLPSLQILALENAGLTGRIPDLSGLTRLKTLNVRNNNLTGSIPTWLEDMDNMVILNLHTNQLTGSIPTQLGNVSNLQQLYLHGNGLTGSVPTQLGSLSSLTNFWIKNNMLSGELPPSLNMLTNLERVRISGNNFTGCVPAALDLEDDPATTVVESDDIALTGLTVCSNGN